MKALYIAFEGLKGCGKSTAFRAVTAHLAAQGCLFDTLCPTQPVRHGLLEWVSGVPGVMMWDGFRERLYAARSHFAARQVTGTGLILGDRSLLTSLVTRWDGRTPASRGESFRRVRRLESAIPIPDHVLLFHAPIEILQARLERRGRVEGRQDETSQRLASAAVAYDQLQQCGHEIGLGAVRWHPIDASQGEKTVADTALAVVDRIVHAIPQRRLS